MQYQYNPVNPETADSASSFIVLWFNSPAEFMTLAIHYQLPEDLEYTQDFIYIFKYSVLWTKHGWPSQDFDL